MLNKNSNTYLINNLYKFFVFSVIFLVQLKQGQVYLLPILLIIFPISLFILVSIKNEINFKFGNILLFMLWTILVLTMIRSRYFYDIETRIELSWLLLGSLFLLFSSLNIRIEEINYKKIIYNISVVIASVTIMSYFFNINLNIFINEPYANTRLMGGFDGPNEFGTYYLLVFSLMLGSKIFNENVKLFYIKTVIFIAAIILSWSRTAIFGLFILLSISFALLLKKYFKNKKINKAVCMLLIYSIAIIISIKYLVPLMKYVRRNSGSRDYLLYSTMKLVQEKFFWGYGIGSFFEISGLPNATPHNEYLFFLISGGILSLIILIFFFYHFYKIAIIKNLKAEALFLIMFYIEELGFNNLIRGRVSILFWIIIMYVLGSYNNTDRKSIFL